MATKKSKSSPKTKTTKKTISKKTAPAVTAKKSSAAPARKTVHSTEPYHPAFGLILLIVSVIMGAALLVGGIKSVVNMVYGDAGYFAKEYTEVGMDNVFKVKTIEETISIIENGTGIVFIGFPECSWCQAYAPMLNSLAKEYGIKEIYYYNVRNARENNTEEYQILVSLLSDYLQEDNAGEKRIYVPETAFIINGEIVGNDYETSKETLGYKTPKEYWTEARIAAWKQNVGALMSKIKTANEDCNSSCNE